MTDFALAAPTMVQLGSRHLLCDGTVLEVFHGQKSMGRILLPGTVSAIEGPDRTGRHEFVVRDLDGHLLFGERIEDADRPTMARLVETLQAAASAPSALSLP